MKKGLYNIIYVLLAFIIMVSAFGVIGAYAAEENESATEATEVTVTEGSPEAVEAPADTDEIALTGATEVATEAPTDAATEAIPTVGKVRNIDRTSFESDLADLTWDPVEGDRKSTRLNSSHAT